MKLNDFILPFYQKLEVSLYYLKHTPNKEKVNVLADFLDVLKNKYKINQTYNEYLINVQSKEPLDWFLASEVWYRNAFIDLEITTKQRLKNIFPLDEFFL